MGEADTGMSFPLFVQRKIDSQWRELLEEYQKFDVSADKLTLTRKARLLMAFWLADRAAHPLPSYIAERVGQDVQSLGEAMIVIAGVHVALAEQELGKDIGKCVMHLMDSHYWCGVVKAVAQKEILAVEINSEAQVRAGEASGYARTGKLQERAEELLRSEMPIGGWKNPNQAAIAVAKILATKEEQSALRQFFGSENPKNTIYDWFLAISKTDSAGPFKRKLFQTKGKAAKAATKSKK